MRLLAPLVLFLVGCTPVVVAIAGNPAPVLVPVLVAGEGGTSSSRGPAAPGFGAGASSDLGLSAGVTRMPGTPANPSPAPLVTPAPTPTPVPTPPVGTPAPCGEVSEFPVVLVPTGAVDDQGHPLPGSLSLGAKAADLPLLRAATRRTLLGSGGAVVGERMATYEVAGATIALRLADRSVLNGVDLGGRVVGARITAPAGFTDRELVAWIRALAPCVQLPDLDRLAGRTAWNHELPHLAEPGIADAFNFAASRETSFPVVDQNWAIALQTLVGRDSREGAPFVLPPASTVPAGRWKGLVAYGSVFF